MINLNIRRFYIALILFFAVYFFSSKGIQAQSYYVLHVEGTITLEDSGVPIKVGDKVSSEASLIFENDKAKAIVMGRKQGRQLLSPLFSDGVKGTKKSGTEELVVLLNEVLHPMQKIDMKMSSRKSPTGEKKLRTFFGEEKFVVIGKSIPIRLDYSFYPLDKIDIVLSYYTSDGKTVMDTLPTLPHNVILLHQDSIYKGVDPKLVTDNKFEKLQKYGSMTGLETEIESLVFLEEDYLRKQVDVLKHFYRLSPRKELYKEIALFVMEAYGKVDQDHLFDWLDKQD